MNVFLPKTAKQKELIAACIAILFHAVGFVGMMFFDREFFVGLSPLNLLLSAGLLIWTQEEKNIWFYLFFLVAFLTGMLTEYIGVNYQLLFGYYQYGTALGPKVGGVPLMIGVNWFVIVLCSGVTVQTLLNLIWNKLRDRDLTPRNNVGFWSFIIDGALTATLFDWIMEPIAVELKFWQWLGHGTIPVFNYICWFFISAGLLLLLRLLPVNRQNQFAVHLLLIQSIFFIALRTFL
jgi:putative membrane protein